MLAFVAAAPTLSREPSYAHSFQRGAGTRAVLGHNAPATRRVSVSEYLPLFLAAPVAAVGVLRQQRRRRRDGVRAHSGCRTTSKISCRTTDLLVAVQDPVDITADPELGLPNRTSLGSDASTYSMLTQYYFMEEVQAPQVAPADVPIEILPELPQTFVPPEEHGQPGLYFDPESPLGRKVAHECQALNSWDAWYEPPTWLQQGDAMSIFAVTNREGTSVSYERHLVETLDGGVVALDVAEAAEGAAAPAEGTEVPFVLLIHGAGGSSEDATVRDMVAAITRAGWRAGVINMRGCGDSPVTTPRFFSACRGSTDDVRCTVRYVREKLVGGGVQGEDASVCLVGWSNGATIAANTIAEQKIGTGLGHEGRKTYIDSGAILSAPYDLKRSLGAMEEKWFKRNLYNRFLVHRLKQQLGEHMHLFEDGPVPQWSQNDSGDAPLVDVDTEAIQKVDNLRALDEALTCKVFGYETAEDYYFDASCCRKLPFVDVPLLCVSAANDPMSSGWVPEETVRNNPNLVLAYTEHGGHVAWQDKHNSQKSFWAEEVVLSFLATSLRHTGK